jgi:hypothetical protein
MCRYRELLMPHIPGKSVVFYDNRLWQFVVRRVMCLVWLPSFSVLVKTDSLCRQEDKQETSSDVRYIGSTCRRVQRALFVTHHCKPLHDPKLRKPQVLSKLKILIVSKTILKKFLIMWCLQHIYTFRDNAIKIIFQEYEFYWHFRMEQAFPSNGQ